MGCSCWGGLSDDFCAEVSFKDTTSASSLHFTYMMDGEGIVSVDVYETHQILA